MTAISPPAFPHLADLLRMEEQRYAAARPLSRQLAESGAAHLLGSVPMSWMNHWPTPFPLFYERAEGARLIDVDGHEYADFCLGDTGAMAGHAPPEVGDALAARYAAGATAMLPTADAAWVAAELSRRFGARRWQFTLSATDANRFAVRICRAITGRPRILSFNFAYHGTVDETFASLRDGAVVARAGNVGPPVDLATTTRVAEFNDLAGVANALAAQDVACVLTEPALTNIGIVLPEPGFLEELTALCRRHGTLLIIDETHTWSAGPGGCTGRWGLEGDIVTLGKAMGGGVPIGAFGLGRGVVAALGEHPELDLEDVGGVGGTLAGNALSLAAARATLAGPLHDDIWPAAETQMRRLVMGIRAVIEGSGLPWHITQLGMRAEIGFTARPPRTGGEAAAGAQPLLERYLHLAALNRGVLITPFHNMFLAGPSTTDHEVDQVIAAVGEAVQTLVDLGRE